MSIMICLQGAGMRQRPGYNKKWTACIQTMTPCTYHSTNAHSTNRVRTEI